MPCPKKYKMFLSYLRVSTKEGLLLDTNITDKDVRFGKYNKDVYRQCEKCCQTFKIELAFKHSEYICNGCYNLLHSENIRDVISPEIIVFYTDNNQLYRICSNIYRSSAQALFRSENIKHKEGTISKESIYKFLNSQTS